MAVVENVFYNGYLNIDFQRFNDATNLLVNQEVKSKNIIDFLNELIIFSYRKITVGTINKEFKKKLKFI